jgi:hypothetical protein
MYNMAKLPFELSVPIPRVCPWIVLLSIQKRRSKSGETGGMIQNNLRDQSCEIGEIHYLTTDSRARSTLAARWRSKEYG